MITQQPSTWITLNKSAFFHNISTIRAIAGKQRKIGLVVKANAYGHGLPQIAQYAEMAGVDWLCVASLQEALTIRALNITLPILVMCFLDDNPARAIANNITIMVENIAQAELLSQCAAQLNMHARIHLKINTGLNRFGCEPAEALTIIHAIKQLSHIALTGIYTHCAAADEQDTTSMQQQIVQFTTVIQSMPQEWLNNIDIHVNNSASLLRNYIPEYVTMVRIGSAAYGLWPSIATQQDAHDMQLQQVISLHTHILSIKNITDGQPIGYGHSFVAPHDMRIALLPIGYNDGYGRFFSNSGMTLVNNQIAPVVGRIGMNITTIDVTHIVDARSGDIVTLLTDHPQLRIDTIAQKYNYNARELCTNLPSTLSREWNETDVYERKHDALFIPGQCHW